MRKALDLLLGIITSVGGFLEIGSIVTSAQAGSEYGFSLLWAVLLGGVCLALLVEMSGRFTTVTKRTIFAAMRERFGFNFFLVPFMLMLVVMVTVVAIELAGVAIALELATKVPFRVWLVPAAGAIWLLLWKGKFAVIEKGVALLALVTVVFLVGAVLVHPPVIEVAKGLVPRWPTHDPARYAFFAVVILGASISPSLFYFYSSGAKEENWDKSELGANKITAGVGMSFGAILSGAVIVLAAMLLAPRGLSAQDYHDLPALLIPVFGKWGTPLFCAALGIACLGAAAEGALVIAYMLAQGLGWNFTQNDRPKHNARFSLAYTIVLPLATVIALVAPNPLEVTVIAMALTSASLPFAVVPFLVLMNDQRWMGRERNGRALNVIVGGVMLMTLVLAIVSIPLQIAAGGG
jgi:NRAMP (natural resistance-associated macrophage protein)-like metal ion transporter